MRAKIRRWGNSLAVRIPKAFADETEIREDSAVEVTVRDEKLVIVPVKRRPTLRSLLDHMTEDNLHGEIPTGTPVGREIW